MDMANALGIAGRAGSIEPECHLVGQGVGGNGRSIGSGEEFLEQMHRAAREGGRIGTDQDNGLEVRQPVE